MYTLICYLSPPKKEEREFKSDKYGEFIGTQTNAVPTCYSIKKLKEQGHKLDRVLYLATTQSDENGYKDEVNKYCAKTGFQKPPIYDSIGTDVTESAASMLAKVLSKLNANETIILETTGGMRNSITMLTLLSRFLYMSGDNQLAFSTYADMNTGKGFNKITEETQSRSLFDLLEATNSFTKTGNVKYIEDVSVNFKFAELTEFYKAAKAFYNKVLVCDTDAIADCIAELKKAIESIRDKNYKTGTSNAVIFKQVVINLIDEKMSFIKSDNPIIGFVQWCNKNGYYQQAATILNEHLKKKGWQYKLVWENPEFQKVRVLRNSINHAEGKAYDEDPVTKKPTVPSEIRGEVMKYVDELLQDPSKIQDFINTILEIMNSKTVKVHKQRIRAR